MRLRLPAIRYYIQTSRPKISKIQRSSHFDTGSWSAKFSFLAPFVDHGVLKDPHLRRFRGGPKITMGF